MTCAICGKNEPDRGLVCEPDRVSIRDTLVEIAEHYPQLADHLEPRRGTGQRVSGSTEPRLPLNEDIADLTSPHRAGQATEHARRWAEDQTGHMPVRARLESWVQDWASHDWCESSNLPIPTVPALAGWLGIWLDRACDHHYAIDDFADETADILAAMRAYIPKVVEVGETPPSKRVIRSAPCPECDMISLWWHPKDDRVRCDNCPRVMTESEYETWSKMVLAQRRAA